jgi:hypothetical protein
MIVIVGGDGGRGGDGGPGGTGSKGAKRSKAWRINSDVERKKIGHDGHNAMMAGARGGDGGTQLSVLMLFVAY